MKLICRLLIVGCVIVFVSIKATGQVIISFDQHSVTRSLYGLYSFSVNNNDDAGYYASFNLILEDEAGKPVLMITNPSQVIARGYNRYNLFNLAGTQIVYYSSPASELARSAQQLPNGSYTWCISIDLTNDKTSTEKQAQRCFPFEILRVSELNLIYPEDKEIVCEAAPLLKWQPLLPLVNGVLYDLKLAEVHMGQTTVEAISLNSPVIYQQSIAISSLSISSLRRNLVEGQRYAWQAIAVVNGNQLAASEIWEFTVGCKDSINNLQPSSYILLSPFNNGSIYKSADGKIPVSFFNPYTEGRLNYSVTDLATDKNLNNLPVQNIINGLNKLVIDLDQIEGARSGSTYILTLKGLSESEYKIIVRYE